MFAVSLSKHFRTKVEKWVHLCPMDKFLILLWLILCYITFVGMFQLVTNFSPKPDDMFHALKNVNLCKNRKLDMVPLSVKRVILPMKPGMEGSDYINATYLQVRKQHLTNILFLVFLYCISDFTLMH